MLACLVLFAYSPFCMFHGTMRHGLSCFALSIPFFIPLDYLYSDVRAHIHFSYFFFFFFFGCFASSDTTLRYDKATK